MSYQPFLVKPFLLIGVLGTWCAPAPAATPKSAEVGISLMSYQMMKLTSSPSGKTDTLGTSFYHLSLQYHQPVGRLLWSPWLRFMPESVHSVRSPNKSSKTSILALGMPFTWNFSKFADLGTGPVLMRYTVHGVGSNKETQNNGESTAEFFQPNESHTASSVVWQVGTAMNYGNLRAGADILVHGPFSATKRSYSLVISTTWVRAKGFGL